MYTIYELYYIFDKTYNRCAMISMHFKCGFERNLDRSLYPRYLICQ